jgi:hypothetical protein
MHAVDFWVAIDVFQLLQQIWVFGLAINLFQLLQQKFILKKNSF